MGNDCTGDRRARQATIDSARRHHRTASTISRHTFHRACGPFGQSISIDKLTCRTEYRAQFPWYHRPLLQVQGIVVDPSPTIDCAPIRGVLKIALAGKGAHSLLPCIPCAITGPGCKECAATSVALAFARLKTSNWLWLEESQAKFNVPWPGFCGWRGALAFCACRWPAGLGARPLGRRL